MAHVFRIVTVALNSEPSFEEWYAPLLATVKSKTEYSKVEDAESAITVLARRPPPSAVLIPDEGLTGNDSLAEWDAVLKYIRIGGTAIVFGSFPSFAQFDDISRGEAAVVLGNVGDGKLGFVGDVNGEAKTRKIIAAMCGLNDT